MYANYEPKDRIVNGTRSISPKADFFRSSLKSKEDLAFLRHREEHQNRAKVRETISKPEYPKFFPKSSKAEDRGSPSFFKGDSNDRNRYENRQTEYIGGNDKKGNMSINKKYDNYQTHSQNNMQRKESLDIVRISSGIEHKNGNNEYQKLHDKLNYLETKIIQMKSNLEKKREEKKQYFQKQLKERQKIIQKDYKNATIKQNRSDPLKEVVSQVNYKKNLKPSSFDPYSPRHNTYYVSEIVRAYKQQNSLAREHLITSIQLLKMLGRSSVPSKQEMASRTVKFSKKAIHQDKKTIIFDLDETLIHCNQNANMPCDVKLPIRFPTGELIYAGINVRPYAVQILKELSKNFEVIIFTASHSCYANVVLDYLDPEGKYISHRLFREHCYYTAEGVHVKDLRVINRDLSQTVLVDNAAYSYAFQIDNGIPIIPYYEGKVDFELKALQNYLQSMLFCKDVRELNKKTFVLHRYADFDNPESLVKQLYSYEMK